MANCLLRAETAESSVADDSYRSSYALYDARLEAVLLKQNELEDRMTGALRNGEFQVYMQPQHNLADNSLHGAEALIRWIPPNGKPIYPDEFIPLFERNGFIRELDLFVLRTVCAWLRQRMDALRAQIYEMCEEKGEYLAMPQARSQAMHYMKGLRGAASLRRYCSMLEHFTDVDTLIDAVYRLQE